jgi:hypothetical protein
MFIATTKRISGLRALLHPRSSLPSARTTTKRRASIRVMGTLPVSLLNIGPYAFTAINLSGAAGVASVLNVQTTWYSVGDGKKWIRPRPWPWFSLYELNNPVPMGGAPLVWSQYGQGSAGLGSITNMGGGTISSGSFYIDPAPDGVA